MLAFWYDIALVSLFEHQCFSCLSLFQTATPADLKSLDLYAHLSSMPKNSMEDSEGAGDGTPQEGKSRDKGQVTKRELGRLKNKMALTRAVEGRCGGKEDREGEGEGQRENKRSKSDVGDAGRGDGSDNAMDES
jgi:tRNA (guanine-N(7)-)-methyltransferase subunit TRM82